MREPHPFIHFPSFFHQASHLSFMPRASPSTLFDTVPCRPNLSATLSLASLVGLLGIETGFSLRISLGPHVDLDVEHQRNRSSALSRRLIFLFLL